MVTVLLGPFSEPKLSHTINSCLLNTSLHCCINLWILATKTRTIDILLPSSSAPPPSSIATVCHCDFLQYKSFPWFKCNIMLQMNNMMCDANFYHAHVTTTSNIHASGAELTCDYISLIILLLVRQKSLYNINTIYWR